MSDINSINSINSISNSNSIPVNIIPFFNIIDPVDIIEPNYLENTTTTITPSRHVLQHMFNNKTIPYAIKNNANYDAVKIIYINYGWYVKSASILPYMKTHSARCYQCYNIITYNNLEYSKIFTNNEKIHKYNNIYAHLHIYKKHSLNAIKNQEKILQLICICTDCYNSNINLNKLPKYAPKHYGDLLADYILNEKFELITNDIETIYNNNNLMIINDKINYLKVNMNEKQQMLNNLINKNAILINNVDLEIEKFQILNQQYINNNELCNSIKNQLLQLTIDLFKDSKQQIDDQINKYTELNNSSIYTVPECKICMMHEIQLVLQCGHTMCNKCYDKLLIISTSENNTTNPAICVCPTCRTTSNTHIQLYI